MKGPRQYHLYGALPGSQMKGPRKYYLYGAFGSQMKGPRKYYLYAADTPTNSSVELAEKLTNSGVAAKPYLTKMVAPSVSGGFSSIQTKFNSALAQNIPQRCTELAKIIDEHHTKDLHSIYTTLLENIFGFNYYTGWGLKTLNRKTQPSDIPGAATLILSASTHRAGMGTTVKTERGEQVTTGNRTRVVHLAVTNANHYTKRSHDHLAWSVSMVEFNAVKAFLCPGGPMFRLFYKLQSDAFIRYEFSLTCLPMPTRLALQEGAVPVFYSNKLQMLQHGRPANFLSLNAFEFFFFQFAYFMAHPQNHKVMNNWVLPADMLYPCLLEDYLNHFLPVEGEAPTLPNTASPIGSPHSPTHVRQQSSAGPYHHTLSSPYGSPHANVLVRRALISQGVAAGDTGVHECWLSESFLQIVTEFWLNQVSAGPRVRSPDGRRPEGDPTRGRPGTEGDREYPNALRIPTAQSEGKSATPQGGNSLDVTYRDLAQQLKDSFMPSKDHVRIVRMLVKHVHYFSNSVKEVSVTSPYHSPALPPIEELKRAIIPQFVQKKLYAFLRHGFDHWPLDHTFRLMLETWLSYVQPWRYSDHNKPNIPGRDSRDKMSPDKWAQFVADNLLFYTSLFHIFLTRVFRLDLSSPRNAYMLFRVAKVYGQPNLAQVIEDCEGDLCEPVPRMTQVRRHGGRDSLYGEGASFLSPPTTNPAAILRMQCLELESSGFEYKLMFGEETSAASDPRSGQYLGRYGIPRVVFNIYRITRGTGLTASWITRTPEGDPTRRRIVQLLQILSQARRTAQTLSQPDDTGTSLLAWMGLGGQTEPTANMGEGEEFGGADLRKLDVHLEQSMHFLCMVFRLDPPATQTVAHLTSAGSCLEADRTLPPECTEGEAGQVLTPRGRYQMMNGLRRFDIGYHGDPELQPIRSYENPALVRALYKVSTLMNQRFSDYLQAMYHRDDLIGRLAHQYLSPPYASPPTRLSPVQAQRRALYSTRPRISLRFLASYQNLGYLLAFLLLAYMFSVGPLKLMLFFLFGLFAYGIIMVVVTYDRWKPLKHRQ
ncbi:sphingomyelin phosphodiesterase 4, neutral membrane (neutral sphingomyelinase-3) [Branchiostoma belcheri]|nr:sphingomyelin phosphodiesterase 4, neutral membrane (neutral sphingomyelinase-3) [Branchiostoma belcheri]